MELLVIWDAMVTMLRHCIVYRKIGYDVWIHRVRCRDDRVMACGFQSKVASHAESVSMTPSFNTLRPTQNGRHFADDTFNRIVVNENVTISIKFSLKFVPKGQINNISALVQIMAWRRPGDKPLSEPVMVSLLTHICVTRPQWVNIPLI